MSNEVDIGGKMDRPLTAKEAASELGYHVHHLYRLLRSGTIKAERFNQVWMIDPAEIKRIRALQGASGRLPKKEPKQSKS
jgi:excisionase family DNA binding protein